MFVFHVSKVQGFLGSTARTAAGVTLGVCRELKTETKINVRVSLTECEAPSQPSFSCSTCLCLPAVALKTVTSELQLFLLLSISPFSLEAVSGTSVFL